MRNDVTEPDTLWGAVDTPVVNWRFPCSDGVLYLLTTSHSALLLTGIVVINKSPPTFKLGLPNRMACRFRQYKTAQDLLKDSDNYGWPS